MDETIYSALENNLWQKIYDTTERIPPGSELYAEEPGNYIDPETGQSIPVTYRLSFTIEETKPEEG
jgi:hypothetical protein